MRIIYTSKRNVEKVWGARYTLGARYLSKNTVIVRMYSSLCLQGDECSCFIKYVESLQDY